MSQVSLFLPAGIYNNLPKEFKLPELPPRGTVVAFRLLQEKTNEILDGKFVRRYPVCYPLPTTGITIDPDTDKSYNIAMVLGVDEKGKIDRVLKRRFDAQKSNGEFYCTIGRPEEDLAYQFFMLIGQRKRTEEDAYPEVPGVMPIYELIDFNKEAKVRRKERDGKYDAIIHAKGLKDEQLRDTAILLGVDDRSDIETMRDAIENHAEAFPNDYMKKVNDGDASLISLFKRAQSCGVLTLHDFEVRYADTSSKMFVMRTNDPIKAPSEFVYWVRTNDIAKEVPGVLKSAIDSKESKKGKGGRPPKAKEE